MDDHSQFVPVAEYMTEATSDNVIRLFEKGAKRFGYPRQTLSDRGVGHIYASVKKPTTCGKLERFWGTHNTERWNYTSLMKFIYYYNYKRPHMSLNYRTPHEIYIKDMKNVK